MKTYLEGEYRLLERSKQTIQILAQKVRNREAVFKQLVELKKLKQENRVKSLNRYGIQDDSTLKVDVNQAVFPKMPTMATLGSMTDRQSQGQHPGPQAFFVRIKIDNLQRQEDQT